MIELVLAAALLLRDPPGDAVGAGGIVPPSAEQYRDVGSFDLLEVQILDSSMLALTIEMGALPNPAGLANGFSNAVIDVYVDQGEGGIEALLPGPEMRMPAGRGWEVALRITGDGATAYRSTDEATASGPSVSYPVRVRAEERVIRVETPFERGEIEGVYALTGVYDPFVASGWRPLAEAASPWAFASNEQWRPVIDLLAPDEVAQAEAIRTGVLPMPRNRTAGAMWMLLMAVGVLVAGVGLVLRRMVRPEAATPVADPHATAEGAESAPATERDGAAAADFSPDAISPTPVPAVTLPTFLPALPPPASAQRESDPADSEHGAQPTPPPTATKAASPGTSPPEEAEEAGKTEDLEQRAQRERHEEPATRRASTEAFGEPDSWLDDPEEDPEAQTWRGEAPAAAEAESESESNGADGAVEPESARTADDSEPRPDKS